MGSWFECKWKNERCNKCTGCRDCGNCINFDKEYYELDDYNCCKWCDDNPYYDDKTK